MPHSEVIPSALKHGDERGIRSAVTHALFWLVAGNAIGVMIAFLLLFPRLNVVLGEWTYGRWIMVHMNIGLFGWCSVPMLGFLFRFYKTSSSPWASWDRSAVWVWSSALVLGAWSWLQGHSSGKLFLDWTGLPRCFFPLAMLFLWALLAASWMHDLRNDLENSWKVSVAKALGIVLLLVVPFAIYVASSPSLYPAFNPDTGGPTGASQLESSLGVVLIFLLLPFGLVPRKEQSLKRIVVSWGILAAESVYCALLNHADISHRVPAQYLGLCLMLAWIPLIPLYYEGFNWHPSTSFWRRAFYLWWGGLVISGCVFFLPGVLDHFKFTDGLVGHSIAAIAGCLTAFLILVQIQMLGNDGWIFLQRRSFRAWNHSVLLYVVLMTIAGWIEGSNPAFTIVPGPLRNLLYGLRLIAGLGMFLASLDWLLAALQLHPRSPGHPSRSADLSTDQRMKEPV